MVDSMSKNDSLDYHFVTEAKAKEGLDKGDYYMVVTFPKSMSKNASSLMTNHPKKVKIDYQTTKGRSFVASKMSDSAIVTLRKKVSESLTKTYTKAVFKSMGTLQSGMGKAANGGQQLVDGADQLKSGSQTLGTGLDTLASSSLTFADGANTLNSGLITYTNGVGQLGNGLTTYTNGVSQVASGLNQLNGNSQQLMNGVNQLSSGTSQVQQLVDGASKIKNGLQAISSNTSAQGNAEQLGADLQQIGTALEDLSNQISSLSSGSGTSDFSNVRSALASIESQLRSLPTTSNNGSGNALAAVQSTSAYQSLTPEQQSEISSAVSSTGTATTDIS
ncbi:MAG: YhgE/Pip family protein, partial [Streptococcus gallolyticus]|nr:YhgE/Pip family protein [Streptococcus gallolyticus]